MAGGPGLTESESAVLPRQLPDPRPQADEVLVRVRAAGINPVDWKIRQGQLRSSCVPSFHSGSRSGRPTRLW
jgi:NADPH:quinone reductase-like Zn-dependent oxidoreductase